MSRIDVMAMVNVYVTDDGEWGESNDEIAVKNYWNDDRGEYATLVVGDHEYTVVVRDLRAALTAVTTR